MRPESWPSIDALFAAALERPASERSRFLDEACGEDRALRHQVDRLLVADGRAAGFLDSPQLGVSGGAREEDDDVVDPLLEAGEAGGYRILKRIGRGGSAAVYLAEQREPNLRRRVALKVLHRSAHRSVRRRFLAESDTLARLEHPGIARLYAVGTLDDGRPYLTMELVEGQPIDRYCEAQRLPIEQRLRLVETLCSAVQLAHSHRLVHRDLKPDNVLVDADGVPKLLDFGIVKRLDPGEEERTLTTHPASRWMTPPFASPEQIRGEPVTPASDLYSLGVLLHRLLAGGLPYRLRSASGRALERAICDEPPSLPSTSLARLPPAARHAVAHRRRLRPKQLLKRLRGDLDAIVAVALAKEPARRYASASELADDLAQHRRRRPVRARRASRRYRIERFTRRHRVPLVAALALSLVAASSAAAVFRESLRARQAEAAATAEREQTERALTYLVDIVESADPLVAGGPPPTIDDLLDRTAAQTLGTDDPVAIDAILAAALGRSYARLGQYDEAAHQLALALTARRTLYPPPSVEVAEILSELGHLERLRGNAGSARRHLSEAVTVLQSLAVDNAPAEALPTALLHAAELARDAADAPQAILLLRLASSLPDSPGPVFERNVGLSLGLALHQAGRLHEAAEVLEQVVTVDRRTLGTDHPSLGESLTALGPTLWLLGHQRQAEEILEEATAILSRSAPQTHPKLVAALNNLAAVRGSMGDSAGVISVHRHLLAIKRRQWGDAHPAVAVSHIGLGVELMDAERFDEAEPHLREALRIRREALGDGHPLAVLAEYTLAHLEGRRGNYPAAERGYRRSIAKLRQAVPPDHVFLSRPLLGLGELLLIQGRFAEAEPLLAEAARIRRGALTPESWRLAEAETSLAEVWLALDRPGPAHELLVRSHRTMAEVLGEDDTRTQRALELRRRARGSKPAA